MDGLNGLAARESQPIKAAAPVPETPAARWASRKLLVAILCIVVGGGLTYPLLGHAVELGSIFAFLTAMYGLYAQANNKGASLALPTSPAIQAVASKVAAMLPKP